MIRLRLTLIILALHGCGGCEAPSEAEQQAALAEVILSQQEGDHVRRLRAAAAYNELVNRCK